MMPDEEKPDPTPEEFQKFEELTRDLLKVSKDELNDERRSRRPDGPNATPASFE